VSIAMIQPRLPSLGAKYAATTASESIATGVIVRPRRLLRVGAVWYLSRPNSTRERLADQRDSQCNFMTVSRPGNRWRSNQRWRFPKAYL
jgi:hypothetical protein